MGFNRVTWTPGHERKPIGEARFRQLARLRRRREARARETAAAHALKGSLMSLAALLGSEVKDSDGRSVGRLSDVVVHWTTRGAYPAVKAIVVKTGKLEVVIGALARSRRAVYGPAAVVSRVRQRCRPPP